MTLTISTDSTAADSSFLLESSFCSTGSDATGSDGLTTSSPDVTPPCSPSRSAALSLMNESKPASPWFAPEAALPLDPYEAEQAALKAVLYAAYGRNISAKQIDWMVSTAGGVSEPSADVKWFTPYGKLPPEVQQKGSCPTAQRPQQRMAQEQWMENWRRAAKNASYAEKERLIGLQAAQQRNRLL